MSLVGKLHGGLSGGRRLFLAVYVGLVLVYAFIVVWFIVSPWTSTARAELKAVVFIGGVALVPLGAVARRQMRGYHPSSRTLAIFAIGGGLIIVVAAAIAVPLMLRA